MNYFYQIACQLFIAKNYLILNSFSVMAPKKESKRYLEKHNLSLFLYTYFLCLFESALPLQGIGSEATLDKIEHFSRVSKPDPWHFVDGDRLFPAHPEGR
jgi:hypothetical protein